ncbi:MAG: acyl carrier protein [Mogibacterium sp.]|nr:acyl carrier protein [Mogibacterium sp.]
MSNTINDVRALAESVGANLSGCDNQTNLFEEGIIDSLQIALMVGEIEKKYSFQFELDEINPDVFESIESISAFIDKKRK